MIHQEIIEIRGRQFLRSASDEFYIRQVETGNIYEVAIDIIPCAFTYEETDESLPPQPEPEEEPERGDG